MCIESEVSSVYDKKIKSEISVRFFSFVNL